ncbi:MAG: hypothetical protein QOF30_3405 [Acidimicrobiaceae bacterium]|jgi:hypothetical protein|nr:hypothetical protein [Acidimicrobiaceae bacterium]
MTATITTAARPFNEAPRPDYGRRQELRGVSKGVIVGAVMGLAWAASALGPLRPTVAVAVAVGAIAVFALLMLGARRLHHAAAAIPQSAAPATDLSRVRRRFTLVVVAECAAIAGAVNILGAAGHREWIPAAICATVGLHFVPLARLFGVALYYATAVALCLAAMSTVILGAAGAPGAIWQLLPGFGAALALWATSAALLVTTTSDRGRARTSLTGIYR